MKGMVDVFVSAILDKDSEFTINDVPERWKAQVEEELKKKKEEE